MNFSILEQYSLSKWFQLSQMVRVSIVAYVLDCDIVASEFEPQSRIYVHFCTNTLVKSMSSLTPPNYRLNSITAIFLQG